MSIRAAADRYRSAASSGRTGAGCGIFFGMVFACFGAVFIGLMAIIFAQEVKPHFWDEIPCQVESCEIVSDESRNEPFQLKVRYRYDYEGSSYTSERYALSDRPDSDYEGLALERARLLDGREEIYCRVDPDDPASAVLKRGQVWFMLFAAIPLIFVVVGLVIVFASVSLIRKGKVEPEAPKSVPLSSIKGKSGCGLIVFGAIFFFVGVGVLVPMFVIPLMRYLDAKDWREEECKILWSKVRSHRGDDGTTYSVDIFYEYEWNGLKQRSNRYGPVSGWSSSGRSGKRDIANQYPRGSTQVCYVNPEIPQQAMLVRSSSGLWFGLIPLIFVAVGAGILVAGAAVRRKARGNLEHASNAAKKLRWSGHDRENSDRTFGKLLPDGSMELRPGKSRWGTVIGVVVFGLIWNGIVGIFVFQLIDGWRRGQGEWFPTLFMIPFVIVGLGAAVIFLYTFLQAFNPRVIVTLLPDNVRLGADLKVRWRLSGSPRRLRSLTMKLKASESATYRRGTRTVTDDMVFFQRELVRTTQPLEMATGSAELMIPEDLMFSFDSGNNRILWEIAIEGDVPNWPDINDSYRIEMLPPETSLP